MSPDERARHDRERAARDAAAKAHWNATHREYKMAWNAEHREEINARERDRVRRIRAARRAKQASRERGRGYREVHREEERERSRRFRADHPDRVREHARRYREQHPDRIAAQSARASMRYRDTHAERLREQDRVAAAENRRANPDQYRDWYARNLERERDRGRKASQLRSRLRALGLPPRRVHRSYASERRARQAEADAFFARNPTSDAHLLARLELEGIDHRTSLHSPTWRGVKLGLDGPPPARVVEQFQRMSALYRFRAEHRDEVERLQRVFERVKGAQIREEMRLDAIARNGRRGPPVDDAEDFSRRVAAHAIAAARDSRARLERAQRDALSHAIHITRTREWWEVAQRDDVATLMTLAHPDAPGPEEDRQLLAHLLDRGSRVTFGLPAATLTAGIQPAARHRTSTAALPHRRPTPAPEPVRTARPVGR